jgi:hypothetical protein
MKLSRDDVFKLITEEREYQNDKWDVTEQSKYSISEWLTMMRKYLNDAENGVFNDNPACAMEAIRKITALGVASIENISPNRTPPSQLACARTLLLINIAPTINADSTRTFFIYFTY